MSALNSLKGWLIKLAGGALAVALAASLALVPAYAASGAVTGPAAGTPPPTFNQALTNIYQREQTWLNIQSNRLTDANTIAVNAQNWINTLKGQGKDTSVLSTALAAFNAQVATAQAGHDTASNILSGHTGFDSSGQVTDRGQAITTLRTAFQSLQSAHLTLLSAAVNLRLAVRNWINANS